MNRVKHLSKEQLFGYAADSLEPAEENEVGRHLLLCADCRKLLPVPTTEQFLSVLLGETEHSEQHHSFEESLSLPARVLTPLSLLFGGRKLAWSVVGGAGALILLIGFSFLIWRATIKPSDTAELARTTVNESNQSVILVDENRKDASDEEVPKNRETESPALSAPLSKKLKISPPPTVTGQSGGKLNSTAEDVELARIIGNTPAAVLSLRPTGTARLRSNSDNSEPKKVFSLIGPVGGTVLETAPEFRWEKAAGAESYKITIFDAQFNEVLTATVSGNRFKPDKALTPGAKYLWRVAAQTADGGEIVAPSLPQAPAIFQIASKTAEIRIQSLKKRDDRFKLALFYAREGMLDLAFCALEKILLQNPEHRSAKRLLTKVARWQKENNTVVQRCVDEPSAIADR